MTNFELIVESIKFSAIIIGGVLGLYEYIRFRRYSVKAQLDIEFDIFQLDMSDSAYLLDIAPKIENKSYIRQKLPKIEIWVNTTTENDLHIFNDETDSIKFSKKLAHIDNIVFDFRDPYFIDPQITQTFPVQLKIENPGEFIMVAVRFYYKVSIIKSLLLYLLLSYKIAVKRKDQKGINDIVKKLQRLKKFRVYKYHIISKIHQMQSSNRM